MNVISPMIELIGPELGGIHARRQGDAAAGAR